LERDVARLPGHQPALSKDSLVSRVFWNLCKYLLAFGVLAWVISQNWKPGSEHGLEHVWNKHVVQGEPLNTGALLLACAILTASLMLTLVRWYFLVRAQNLPFRLWDAFRLGLVGFFFNTVLPGAVGGDVVKAAGLARTQSRRTIAVATVIMDRIIALWALVWFVALFGGTCWLLGLLDGPSAAVSLQIIRVAGLIIATSVVVWLLLGFLPPHRAERFAGRLAKIPRIGNSAAEFWRAVWMYRCRQASVALALVLSWGAQIGFIFGFYFSVRALWDPQAGNIPTVFEHFLLVPIGMVIEAAPLFPGGAGIGEAGYGGLYLWFGCPAAFAILGSLMQRLIKWAIGLAGYLVYLRMRASLPHDTAQPTPGPDETEVLDPEPASDVVLSVGD
jgi:glycosyltransferase 2 family protein